MENKMSKQIAINGVLTDVPAGAVAYKFADPVEGARWVYDDDDAREISKEDPSLLIYCVA